MLPPIVDRSNANVRSSRKWVRVLRLAVTTSRPGRPTSAKQRAAWTTGVFLLMAVTVSVSQADIRNWRTRENIPGTEGITPGPGINLSGRNSDSRNLRYAVFSGNDLSGATFARSWLDNARFWGGTPAKLTQADLSYANLTNANLFGVPLANADLTGAIVTGTWLGETTAHGFTKEQLYSTASYQQNDLAGIWLGSNDLSGWNFAGQNLARADFGRNLWPQSGATLTGADLSQANLAHANFIGATLSNADLSGAIVNGTWFTDTTTHGFTMEQLYSTASYQQKDLAGINLSSNDVSGWDLAGQDLTNANMMALTLTSADLSGASLNNANFTNSAGLSSDIFSSSTTYTQWTIFPDDFDPVAAGLTLIISPAGDFDADNDLNVSDVDLLLDRILPRHWPFHSFWLDEKMFDLNADGTVDTNDLHVWVKDLKHTSFGDANLDGEFNSADLVAVFSAGEYEDMIENNSSWADGDWDADGDFTSGDLVAAFADGGYEQGPRIAPNVVPEPASVLMVISGVLGVLTVSRTRCHRR